MNISYKYLGYMGAIPFILAALGFFFTEDSSIQSTLTMLMMFYGGMILSFLAGVQWAHAIKNKMAYPMIVSMVPTIASFFIAGLSFLTGILGLPLLLMGAGFIVLYWLDLKYLDRTILPKDYLSFRLSLSVIVAVCFGISAFTLWV